MQHEKTETQISSIQSCLPHKSYRSWHNRPTVWTAPWCCNPCPPPCPPHFPTPFPPHHNFPPNPPCHPNWQPVPPQHCTPNIPDWQRPCCCIPPCSCHPHPKPQPPKPPKPKPPKPNFPDNCSQDMAWLLIGYWMGSNCHCVTD